MKWFDVSIIRSSTTSTIHLHRYLCTECEVQFKDIKNSQSRSQSPNDLNRGSVTEERDSQEDQEYENNVRNKILEASLKYVAEHGWTKAAIIAGAQSIGYPGIASEMFPLGGSNLVLYFYSECNAKLTAYMKTQSDNKPSDIDKQYVKLFVYDAVEYRLRLIIPYMDKWPQALATLTLSKAVPTALSNLLTLVDDICYHAGDRSVDFDWYVRRIALAGIYKTTELYMLQDKSEDFTDTWEFLKMQLDEAVAVYSCIRKSEQASQLTKEICMATFTTARNILGLNWKK